MSDDPLVTVIIPTYGRPQFLEESVQSIADQTYSNIELIVVDDCSPAPVEISRFRSGEHLRIVRHARNMGPGAARNTGVAHARGRLITFLDDDDAFVVDRIERGVREIGSANMHAVQSSRLGREYSGDLRSTLHHGDPPNLQQVIYRREDLLQFDPTLRVAEDREWWLRMQDRAIFAWSGEPGLLRREHSTPRPGVDPLVRLRCREIVAFKHAPGLDRVARSHQFNRVASSALLAGRRFKSARYAAKSMMSNPSVAATRLLVRSLTPFPIAHPPSGDEPES